VGLLQNWLGPSTALCFRNQVKRYAADDYPAEKECRWRDLPIKAWGHGPGGGIQKEDKERDEPRDHHHFALRRMPFYKFGEPRSQKL
jgi:hypothetical protein